MKPTSPLCSATQIVIAIVLRQCATIAPGGIPIKNPVQPSSPEGHS